MKQQVSLERFTYNTAYRVSQPQENGQITLYHFRKRRSNPPSSTFWNTETWLQYKRDCIPLKEPRTWIWNFVLFGQYLLQSSQYLMMFCFSIDEYKIGATYSRQNQGQIVDIA
jgi:hypothetical protein